VVNFGWRINHVKYMIPSWLQNVFLKFPLGRGVAARQRGEEGSAHLPQPNSITMVYDAVSEDSSVPKFRIEEDWVTCLCRLDTEVASSFEKSITTSEPGIKLQFPSTPLWEPHISQRESGQPVDHEFNPEPPVLKDDDDEDSKLPLCYPVSRSK